MRGGNSGCYRQKAALWLKIGRATHPNRMSPGDDKLLFLRDLEQEKVITHQEFYDYMVAQAVSDIKTGKPMTPVFERLKATLTREEQESLVSDILTRTIS
ncbi:MAG: hypothetical protein IPM23_18730 [Candidatus Melainabacteria bacterium]|nr:hypothetical protein [Candidatus Melainabacteria bacterium]